MRILFLLNRYPGIGGIENITSLLARLFKSELGHQISIFSVISQHDVGIPVTIRQDEIPVIISNSSKQSEIIRSFTECLINYSPEIVIFQDSYAEIEYLLNFIDKSTKIFVVEHNTPDCLLKSYINHYRHHKWCSFKGFVRKLLFPLIYLRILFHQQKRHKKLVDISNRYILLSASYKEILKLYYNIVSDKIIAIPNIKNDYGLDTNVRLLDKKKQVLFVGRLNPQKGLDHLLEIWQMIEKFLPDYKLIVIGDGEERETFDRAIKENNLKNVNCIGYIDNVYDYYIESSAIFMTSNFEGLPLVLAEAMQFGVVPFVYDTFSSVYDVISDSNNGYIIPPFNKKEFVTRFTHFISLTKESQLQMRINAITSSEGFSARNVLHAWKNILLY